VIWQSVFFYLMARLSQLWADRLPPLLIVLLHVLPPAVLAMVHGSVLYGRKGVLIYSICCFGIAGFFESLSLRTGFPFGHYYFTDVMGPKLFGLPFLLVLAYLGIGYCSWVLALLTLGYREQRLSGTRAVALPVFAALLMVAWDLAMDAAWATVDRAWIWQSGGAFYGVPVSNFFGWYLTAYLFFQAFALSGGAKLEAAIPLDRSFWRTPILVYFLCATGNLLLFRLPGVPSTVIDASGKRWITQDIFAACAMNSVLLMVPFAVLAWLRLAKAEQGG